MRILPMQWLFGARHILAFNQRSIIMREVIRFEHVKSTLKDVKPWPKSILHLKLERIHMCIMGSLLNLPRRGFWINEPNNLFFYMNDIYDSRIQIQKACSVCKKKGTWIWPSIWNSQYFVLWLTKRRPLIYEQGFQT